MCVLAVDMCKTKYYEKDTFSNHIGVLFSSCEPEVIIDPIENKNKVITSDITTNTTWYSDTVYQLGGRITVEDGATLTIQPGTIIKGEAGTGSNATALLIARGGKIIADGTPQLPIIFTSVADEITPEMISQGNFASPNLDPTVNGLWGGLIVLGKARISASNTAGDVSSVQIEGIPTSDPSGLSNRIFDKSPTTPDYLTPIFFKKAVLDKYYQQPDKYSVEK